MKTKHKVLISIAIIFAVVTSVIYQVDKTNRTLEYNKQQQEIKIANDKLLLEAQENDKKEKKYTQLIKTVKEGDWSKAKETDWENLRGMITEINGYKDVPTISLYVSSLKYYYNGEFGLSFKITKEILKTYNSGSIKEGVDNINSKSKVELLKDIQDQRDKGYAFSADYMEVMYGLVEPSPTVNTLPKPRIGMTANEVSNSYWGKPIKVNRTTTANGVSEQWVYGSSRYVYLNNGIVTAIQD